MTQPAQTVAPVRDVVVVLGEVKRLAGQLSKVDVKAAESEKEVAKCNEQMLDMMNGKVEQTGANNIAVIAKEQQKFLKKAEKTRENAVEGAQALLALQEELNGMVDALIAPYKSKFVDSNEPTLDEDADGADVEEEVEETEA